MDERKEASNRAEALVREVHGRHVCTNEGRTWNKLAGTLDLHRRDVDTGHGVVLRQPSYDRNTTAASEIEDSRTSLDALLQQIEPIRVVAIISVVRAIGARD